MGAYGGASCLGRNFMKFVVVPHYII